MFSRIVESGSKSYIASRLGNRFNVIPALKIARSFIGSLVIPPKNIHPSGSSAARDDHSPRLPSYSQSMNPTDESSARIENTSLMETFATMAAVNTLAATILPSVFGLPFVVAQTITSGVGLLSLQANSPIHDDRKPALQNKVGPKVTEIAFVINKKFLKDPTEQKTSQLVKTLQSYITEKTNRLVQRTPSNLKTHFQKFGNSLPDLIAQDTFNFLKNGLQDPEFTILQLCANLQDQIERTSLKELLSTFEEGVDFLKTYGEARKKLEGKTFANSLEEKKAWGEAFGDKWHKAFPFHTNDPFVLHDALERYLDETLDKLRYVLIPSEHEASSALLQGIEEEVVLAEYDSTVKPQLRQSIKELTFALENHHELFSQFFTLLEKGISYLEKDLHVQILPSPIQDNLFLTEVVEGKTFVRACSKKAQECDVCAGMELAEAAAIYQAEYRGETIVTKPATACLSSHQILVDSIGGLQIVRDCSQVARAMGIYVGMNALEAQIIYNRQIGAEDPVADLITRDNLENGFLFQGRLSLEQSFAKIFAACIEHGPDQVIGLIKKHVASFPLGLPLITLCSFFWSMAWPIRKTSFIALKYLIGIPAAEKIGEQVVGRLLMSLRTPAFKIACFRWLDRAIDILLKHKKDALAANLVVDRSQQASALAQASTPRVTEQPPASVVRPLPPTPVSTQPSTPMVTIPSATPVVTEQPPTSVVRPLPPTPVSTQPSTPMVTIPSATSVVTASSTSPISISMPPRENAVLGDLILALLSTVAYDFAPITQIYVNVSKSRILGTGLKFAFWSTRMIVKISIKAMDSRVNHFLIDKVAKKIICMIVERFYGKETFEQNRIFIDKTFEIFNEGIHLANQPKEFRLILHAEIAMVYRKAAEMAFIDPDQKFLDHASQDWGCLIHGTLMAGLRTSIVILNRSNAETTAHLKVVSKFTTKMENKKEQLPKLLAEAEECLQKYSLAIQSLDEEQMALNKQKLEEALMPIREISTSFESFIAPLTKAKDKLVDQQNKQAIQSLQTADLVRDLNSELSKLWEMPKEERVRLKVKENLNAVLEKIDQRREALKKELTAHKKELEGAESTKIGELNFLNHLSKYLHETSKEFEKLKDETNPEKWLKTMNVLDYGIQRASEWLMQTVWKAEEQQTVWQSSVEEIKKKLEVFSKFPALQLEGGLYDQVKKTEASLKLISQNLVKEMTDVALSLMKVSMDKAFVKSFSSSRMKDLEDTENQLKSANAELELLLKERENFENQLLDNHSIMQEVDSKRAIKERCQKDLVRSFETPAPAPVSGWRRQISFVVNEIVNWEERAHPVERKREDCLEDLRKFLPRQFESLNRREARIMSKIERLESHKLFKERLSDNKPFYLDPVWWMERSGKELFSHLSSFVYHQASLSSLFAQPVPSVSQRTLQVPASTSAGLRSAGVGEETPRASVAPAPAPRVSAELRERVRELERPMIDRGLEDLI